MTSPALRRLQKEYADLQATPLEGISVDAEESLMVWKCNLDGPEASLYAGGRFELIVSMPGEYPFKAPSVTFHTKIYHPSIASDGSICLSMLKANEWKPGIKVVAVLQAIVSLLCHPDMEDGIETSVAQVLRRSPSTYERTAREWTERYARRQP